MTKLESRKLLLIAESDLNRALLAQDIELLTDELHDWGKKTMELGAMASSAANFVADVSSLWNREPEAAPKKTGWPGTVFKVLRLAVPIWSAFRKNGR